MFHLRCRVLAPLLLAGAAADGQEPPAARDPAASVRLGDLCHVEGVRSNHLTGLGLVVGLNGTGDGGDATRQIVAGMFRRFAVNVTERDVTAGNVAAVMVTALLPPFSRPGAALDVTLSSVGGAKSLFGGTLLLTELKGFDGLVYAVAQGPVSVGGFSFGGQAATVQRNHPTVGRVPNGALVEREVPMRPVLDSGTLRLLLRDPSFGTAQRIAEAVNGAHAGAARAVDAAAVALRLPPGALEAGGLPPFLSRVLSLRALPDVPARVVINERTGTLVAGEHVTVAPVAISHGNLNITVVEIPEASQALPLARGGETVVLPRTETEAREEKNPLASIGASVTLGALARSLNALGLSPRDLISILQAMKEAGALRAEIILQ